MFLIIRLKCFLIKLTISPDDKWSLVPASYGTALMAGGVVVAGIVMLLAIAAVVSPFFGYRLCQIFSTCDGQINPTYTGDVYSQGYSSSQYPSYQKRQVCYYRIIRNQKINIPNRQYFTRHIILYYIICIRVLYVI